MAYLYYPHVTQCKVEVYIEQAHGGKHTETYTFVSSRDGVEATNQVADTILSALHLACAIIRERNDESTGVRGKRISECDPIK